jgi:hypothetical protein
MDKVAVDTNPLSYIYYDFDDLGKEYAVLLEKLSRNNVLIIPKIVFGELSLIFDDPDDLKPFMIDTGIVIGDMSPNAYIAAANRWQTYNERRVLSCHRCGARLNPLICKKCQSVINIRQHLLSDFMIGAFALESGGRLVTHDKGYFSTYFPELNILTVGR